MLQALQQFHPPPGVPGFDALRDYPRSEYNDISTGAVKPSDVTVSSARFALEPEDLAGLPPGYDKAVYEFHRNLDNSDWHDIIGGPTNPRYDAILSKDLLRMAAYADEQHSEENGAARPGAK